MKVMTVVRDDWSDFKQSIGKEERERALEESIAIDLDSIYRAKSKHTN